MNDYIAWDKEKCIFVLQGEIIFSFYGDNRIVVAPNCIEYIGDSCHDNYNENRFCIFKDIGLKDINEKSIYADSSIVEFKNSQLWNKYNGIFFYNKEKLCYQIKIIGSIRNNEIIPYDKYCSDFKIIDTIQENKLGLIK